MVKNIIMSGVGGQGILLAAKIIAKAAESAGFQVAAHEIHGMAQRGGSVTARIRFGEQFYSPLFLDGEADLLASMEAIEAIRNAHLLKKEGVAVVSALRIIPVTVSSGKQPYPADAEERLQKIFRHLVYRDFATEGETLGNLKLANTVMLGTLSCALPEIPESIWTDAVSACVKPQFVQMNLQAFNCGRKLYL